MLTRTGYFNVTLSSLTRTAIATYRYDVTNSVVAGRTAGRVKAGDVDYTWNALGQLTRDGTYTYILRQAQDRPGTPPAA